MISRNVQILFATLILNLYFLASYQWLSTTTTQLNLSLCLLIGLLGIVFFDEKKQISANVKNIGFFVLFSGLLFLMINENSKERFFLALAGSMFAINIFNESDSSPWSGAPFLTTPWVSTLLFSNLLIIECVPGLPAETIMILDLVGLLVLAVQDVFFLRREGGLDSAGSYYSTLRFLVVGLASYIYGHYFLPQISETSLLFYSFNYVLIGLAAISGAVSIFAKKSEKKMILFYLGLNCFALWSGLYSRKQGFELILFLLVGSWTLIASKQQGERILSRLLVYIGPAVFLIVPLLGVATRSNFPQVSGPNLLWFSFLILSWGSLWNLQWKKWVDKRVSFQQGALICITVLIIIVWAASLNIEIVREKF